jgi:hypothetical protein
MLIAAAPVKGYSEKIDIRKQPSLFVRCVDDTKKKKVFSEFSFNRI